MNRCMIERGPDDEGSYVDREAGVSLGARRLSILDVEGGHQPLANEDGTIWAVLNGEIYNYPALRERLLSRGHTLATRTDTEVLVHLYEDFGEELVHAVEGMFAFAIWDTARRRLLVARDRFGEKPLFYCERGGSVAFASELDALTTGTGLEAEILPHALDAFFVLGYVPGPGSIVKGVRQLPPGHRLLWEAGGGSPRVDPYWTVPPIPAGDGDRVDEELTAELESLLSRSVASRMLADVPLGVFLSGGTDSMLIAALAARSSRDPIKTFTVDYDTGEVGEGVAARRVAELLGADHHELVLTEARVSERVPALLAGLDQPLADQALVALHAVSEFARPTVTVALGGEGADELFGGYPRYRWLDRSESMRRLVPAAAARGVGRSLERVPRARALSRLGMVVSQHPLSQRHLDWVTFGRQEVRAALYGPELSPVLDAGNGLVDPKIEETLNGHSEVAALMRLDLGRWLPDDVLAKADRASMRASLEMRTPYLDRELAELALATPATVHFRGRGKRLLRALGERVAPEATWRSPKRAFRVPAGAWLRGPLREPLREQLARGALFEEGWFDRAAATALVDEHMSGRRGHEAALWPLLSVGLWLDRVRRPDGS
jgi:asparagine synthase (glutamine-hydrolysing)